MGEAIKNMLHNPIVLIILGMGGFWILIRSIQMVYKKFFTNSKRLKKLWIGLKSFFTFNVGIKSYRQFRQELPYKLKRRVGLCQHYFNINLSDTNSIIKHTQYDHFHRHFYHSYKPLTEERYALDDKHFIYEIGNERLSIVDKIETDLLRRLWKKVFRHGAPVVIISLDIIRFEQMDREETRILSQNIRHKIDIIQKIKKAGFHCIYILRVYINYKVVMILKIGQITMVNQYIH